MKTRPASAGTEMVDRHNFYTSEVENASNIQILTGHAYGIVAILRLWMCLAKEGPGKNVALIRTTWRTNTHTQYRSS